MKQAEPCSQQEAVDHQVERSLRADPCRAAVNFVDVPGRAALQQTYPRLEQAAADRRRRVPAVRR